jgi:murein DD-endopeptidase MepM/ murein hydrolase activator NlpD
MEVYVMNFGDKMKKAFKREKIIKFLDKQGFYIVLFLCVAVIGGTAIWTSRNHINIPFPGMDNREIEEKQGDEEPPIVREEKDDMDIKVSDKEDPSTEASKQDQEKLEEKKTTSNQAKAASKPAAAKSTNQVPNLIQPTSGKVILPYAEDYLVYSKTLEQWTTHNGIDIAAKEGTEVKAVLGGVVEEADEDVAMGYYILIDHGNGLKTKYANLSTLDLVKVGQKVERGDVISAVGKSATFEIEDEAHLHFEAILNGKNVDPKEYMID